MEGTVDDQETRLTAAEENIQGRYMLRNNFLCPDYLFALTDHYSRHFDKIYFAGLQMADVELDARVTALEETGGGNSINGTLLNFRWTKLSLSWLALFALSICNLRAILQIRSPSTRC